MLIPDVCCASLSGMCSLVPPSDVNLVAQEVSPESPVICFS